ncbi:helix-turn-helix domain-containing protein [Streptomyces sp. JJ66]|uniref:helix-turn-helix domain-containing protein n=1 Tax=Streptomyces sp. JJ66 TaxID=2803843 RepID=UPI001C55CFEA|nr:helix-turn-helix domain-containing protein [Streptomyces sp. JJ66]MBW1603873.1 helix-turn-helix domain-containing protein [Streptomyces sp. JJ66]
MTTSDTTRFGELLQQYRRRARLTQTELSGFSTVSVRAIRNLELGQARNPRRETVRLLVDALRLGGAQRAALQLAAGLEADDTAFLDLPALPALAVRRPHGRDAELELLLDRLTGPDGRYVGIGGLAGVGKTRLALAVAHALGAPERPGPTGAGGLPTLWLSVRRLVDPVDRRVPDDLTVPPVVWLEGLLTRNGAATGEAARLIGDRPVLLVVDGNDRAEVARDTLEALLAGCRNLRVLETSRVPGPQPADFRIALRPLPTPALTAVDDLRGALADPALRVLVDRITDLQPDFRLDAGNVGPLLELCARLDGLPRALEAAASWLPLCSPAEITRLARVEPHVAAGPADAGPGADWVTEALDDALEDLSPARRALLCRLADWDAPWTMEQVVTAAGTGRAEVASAVDCFLRRGLIRRLPSAHLVVFGVLHIVRASLRARTPHIEPIDHIHHTERTEERHSDGTGFGRTARGRDQVAGLLGDRAGRGNAA